ncbi:MAG: PilN domain-containing protein [Gammaproteobacteria bacterium]|nr:PilN domain-containing protein [Gammaproteobacteria bacterium]
MFGLDLNHPETLIGIRPLPDGKFGAFHPDASTSHVVAIALSGREVLCKVLPWNTHRSDSEILVGLKQHFADFVQPLVIDFQRLNDNHLKIMMSSLERVKQLCASVPSHFIIRAIDHESYAIARALKKTGVISEETFCFYYTENNLVKISVFDKNLLIFYDEWENIEKINQHPLIENIKRVALENKSHLLALGLALREKNDWNLHPSQTEKEHHVHEQGILFLVKATLYSILLCFIAHILLMGLVFSQHTYNHFLEKEFQKTWQSSFSVQSQKTQIISMETQMKTLQQLRKQQQPSTILLQSLMHAMPEGVFLMQLSLQDNHVQLEGRAVTAEQTQTLLNNLKKVSTLETPVMNTPQPDASEPPYQFSFSVSATLRRMP